MRSFQYAHDIPKRKGLTFFDDGMIFSQKWTAEIRQIRFLTENDQEIMAHQQFQKCIDACVACATECSHCATSCLNEQNVAHLKTCIQLDLECAAICRAAAEVMSLGSGFSAHMCRVCADACSACADECEKHAQMGMEHCRECAEACRRCAASCEEMATAV